MTVVALDPSSPVSVAPTATTLATFDTSKTQTLTVQVTNSDGAQTLACTIQRRAIAGMAFADTTLSDLVSIGPGVSVAVDIDCGGNLEVRILGTASGAGLSALIGARDKPRTSR